MKIEIGPDGKIIGTKRVSRNGQVSGLTEYAGKEVLIVLPGESAGATYGPEDVIPGVKNTLEEQMRVTLDEYDELRRLYRTPYEATRAFLKSMALPPVKMMLDEMDRWAKRQAEAGKR